MKIKLEYSKYDEEMKISYAIVNTDLGEFDAISELHNEDKDIESSFAGCEYAETKAIRKYFRARQKKIQDKIRTLQDFEKVLKQKKDTDYNSSEWRTLRKQIYILQSQEKEWQNKIDTLTHGMLERMTNREKIINKMINNK